MKKKQMLQQVRYLKNQINPHFLFNTLNNLYALSIEKSDEAPEVIEKLSCAAKQLNITHGIIIMIELGDLREGVMPELVIGFMQEIIDLPNIIIKGIGANLACRYGIATDDKNMSLLSNLADDIEAKFDLKLDIISGGNTASIDWAINHTSTTRVNNLRIGEAIFLGFDSLTQEKIEGLYTDAITLTAEVIESKLKPSLKKSVIKNCLCRNSCLPKRKF